MRYWCEYALLKMLLVCIRLMPLRMRYAVADVLGICAYSVLRVRRRVTEENIERAFGSSFSSDEIRATARRSYREIARTFIELTFLDTAGESIISASDTSESAELCKQYTSGRGMVVVSAHYGSWEMMGAILAARGYTVHAVAKRIKNPYLNDYVETLRKKLGMVIHIHDRDKRGMVRSLRAGELVILVSDQDAGKNGEFVRFFDHEASTPNGAAALALKFAVPIVVVVAERISPGRYKLVCRHLPVSGRDTVHTVTQKYTSAIESILRRHPEQYFWMHRRWKTRPSAPDRDSSGMAGIDNDNDTRTLEYTT